MFDRKNQKMTIAVFVVLSFSGFIPALAKQKKALTFQDVMKFREIRDPAISQDGRWIVYSSYPDRGDGQVKVLSADGRKKFTMERGEKPVISRNGRWIATVVLPSSVELEKSRKKKEKEKPKEAMALLNTESGEMIQFEKVARFEFSEDSKWLAFHTAPENTKTKDSEKSKNGEKAEKPGTPCVLYCLDSKEEKRIPWVEVFAFDSTAHYFAYAMSDSLGEENGLYLLDLTQPDLPSSIVDFGRHMKYAELTWNNKQDLLAYVSASTTEKSKKDSASLFIWDPSQGQFSGVVTADGVPEGWRIPLKNELVWTLDGKRLFFGMKPDSQLPKETKSDEEKEAVDLFDIPSILEDRELDVWHWNDPFIIPHQKKRWDKEKDRTYCAVYHLDSGKVVPLADETLPEIEVSQNPHVALGWSDVPYRKLITWEGFFRDCSLVDLQDGSRKNVVSRLEGSVSLSPEGKFAVYYQDKDWHLYDCEKETTYNLTEKLTVPFYDEDHDYPSPAPGYGMAGWVGGDEAVLIYDKYDIWQFSTVSGDPLNITGGRGRKDRTIFRIERLDPKQRFFQKDEKLLLSSYHDLQKHYGFYVGTVGTSDIRKLLEEKKRFQFLAKAKGANALIYTRESYTEFPDIWVGDTDFRSRRRISNENPQMAAFALGTAERVEWNSMDGLPLQGILIKPGNYEPGKRYPVLVYFYQLFSQRLYEFNSMAVNHRPNFPFYASNGYALFLPDIRFEIGRPGFSAIKCLVPGVQKLIDMGIADPKAIALHGHSWSGYQTAFVITQTDIFCCAIAGAPVSNMTSAYSGIRWESGLARQFQYEQSQSRIGGSLWETPERYIENSPVFFADRVHTPLLVMFGDEDGAVPWYQGIELYLAMRRLGKECIFLEYRGEPHQPQKYPNKVDYAIKMKEYLDHYCKGTPPAKWIKEGVPYLGK